MTGNVLSYLWQFLPLGIPLICLLFVAGKKMGWIMWGVITIISTLITGVIWFICLMNHLVSQTSKTGSGFSILGLIIIIALFCAIYLFFRKKKVVTETVTPTGSTGSKTSKVEKAYVEKKSWLCLFYFMALLGALYLAFTVIAFILSPFLTVINGGRLQQNVTPNHAAVPSNAFRISLTNDDSEMVLTKGNICFDTEPGGEICYTNQKGEMKIYKYGQVITLSTNDKWYTFKKLNKQGGNVMLYYWYH